jgi:hypothetical protein
MQVRSRTGAIGLVAALAERFNAALIGVSAWAPTRLMRHRAPDDDPPAKRCPEPYRGHPVTLGDTRSHGWPDETAVRDLCPKAVCTRCGIIGADVRPKWDDRPTRETLLGAQWRR